MGRVWVVPVLENMAQLSVAGDLVMFLVLLVFFFGGGLWTTSRAGCSPLLNCIPQGFRQWMGTSSSNIAQRRGVHQGTNNAGKRSGATESSGLGLFPVFCCSPRCRALAFARWLWC